MEINREEVKEEVFKLGKWTRFIFMFLYAFVLNFVISVSIGLAFIQFLFYLFTSKVNESLSDFNNHLFLFVSDTLKFLHGYDFEHKYRLQVKRTYAKRI